MSCEPSAARLDEERRRLLLARLVDASDSGLEVQRTRTERAALPVALARQPLWSVGGWVADLDDEDAARAHAAGLHKALEFALGTSCKIAPYIVVSSFAGVINVTRQRAHALAAAADVLGGRRRTRRGALRRVARHARALSLVEVTVGVGWRYESDTLLELPDAESVTSPGRLLHPPSGAGTMRR